MANWIKKDIKGEDVKRLCSTFKIDPLQASIFLRRDITQGKDILFYLEDDMRYTHNPFLLNQMEDAVDRILDAKEEDEKILIFGDRDVDGITSTTLLYQALLDFGIKKENLTYKIPVGDDPYGLTQEAVKNHADNYGSLIITVDCGISNHKEIEYAATLGIDVIVTDHHNQNAQLPDPAIVINPKRLDSTYPFTGISGCAVAFKLVQALRFSNCGLYKQDICLLTVTAQNDSYKIECARLHNLIRKSSITEEIIPGTKKITDTKLVDYLSGQQIFIWDSKQTQTALTQIFGNSVEFNTFDLYPEITKIFPSFANTTLTQLKAKSKIALYNQKDFTELDAFENVFITYSRRINEIHNPAWITRTQEEIQLVMLAAIADIMPVQNENRIFIKHGLKSINSGKTRQGLIQLLSRLELLGRQISSTDISWSVVPALNSCGRMGIPQTALDLFITDNPAQRDKLAAKIIETNTQRKSLVNTAWDLVGLKAQDTMKEYNQKFCVLIDDRINRGILGLIAAKLVQRYKVPSFCITCTDEQMYIGSMRSTDSIDCTQLLSGLGDIFINYGGHNAAAGFSMEKDKLSVFLQGLKNISSTINVCAKEDDIVIDALLPPEYLNQDVLAVCEKFEPSGQENPTLMFMAEKLNVSSAQTVGKTEKQHLKLVLDTGIHKIPAIFWGQGALLGSRIHNGQQVDAVFTAEKNVFNGNETLQLKIIDLR